MNFKVIEGKYANLEEIKEDFIKDYLFSTELSNPEIRRKYGLTWNEFYSFCDEVKNEYGCKKRPKKVKEDSKYYYPMNNGFIISKRIKGKNEYLGFVLDENTAIHCVELCKKANWDILLCKHIIKLMKGI